MSTRSQSCFLAVLYDKPISALTHPSCIPVLGQLPSFSLFFREISFFFCYFPLPLTRRVQIQIREALRMQLVLMS